MHTVLISSDARVPAPVREIVERGSTALQDRRAAEVHVPSLERDRPDRVVLFETSRDNTLRDILLDDSRPASELLPEDPRTPFDNDYTMQQAGQPLVESIEILAREAAERLIADPERMAQVVGCDASGPDDEACMGSFVQRFGRLALRRSLASAEIGTIRPCSERT